MKWFVQQIRDSEGGMLPFSTSMDVQKGIQERRADIKQLTPVNVAGYFVAIEDEIILSGNVQTSITLPSTRTLEDVTLTLDFPINERYVYQVSKEDRDDSEEVIIELVDDFIDLRESVIDNILLNIPMKVIGENETDDKLPSGKDWSVITEETYIEQHKKKADAIDPRFAKLQNLLESNEE